MTATKFLFIQKIKNGCITPKQIVQLNCTLCDTKVLWFSQYWWFAEKFQNNHVI
jgi:hypothetical protein